MSNEAIIFCLGVFAGVMIGMFIFAALDKR